MSDVNVLLDSSPVPPTRLRNPDGSIDEAVFATSMLELLPGQELVSGPWRDTGYQRDGRKLYVRDDPAVDGEAALSILNKLIENGISWVGWSDRTDLPRIVVDTDGEIELTQFEAHLINHLFKQRAADGTPVQA